MNKKLLFVLSMLLPLAINAQIKVLDANSMPKPQPKPVPKYDSLSNMYLQNLNQLVGQTLFLNSNKGASYSYRQSLYDKPNPDVFEKEVNFNTYFHHYFYVKSVNSTYVELVDTTLNKTLYLHHKYNDECFGKFLVVGYYEKMKKEFIGKSFYFLSDETSDNYSKIPAMTIFKCTDVYASPSPFIAFELGNFFLLKATVENPKYGKLIVNVISRPPKSNTLSEFISVKDYNRLVKKYGKVNGRMVAEHSISIGMTKSMVLDSWGDPDEINVTSRRTGSEQWIYGNHYLYFRNGKLVDRQVF